MKQDIVKELSSAILKLTQEYEDWGIPLEVINTGHCFDFAEEIMKRLPLPDSSFITTEDFYDNDDAELPLDKVSEFLPPYGRDDGLRKYFGRRNHAWITYNHKHYDAEVPDGVEHIWEIPLFKRLIDKYYSARL